MRMVAPRTGAPEITLAEEQTELRPMVVARYDYEEGEVLLSRWRLTDEERQQIADGEDIYLGVLTFGMPMQPVAIQVGPEGWEPIP